VVTTGQDHTLRLWDGRTGSELLVLPLQDRGLGRPVFATWSPDGSRLLTAGEGHGTRVWAHDPAVEAVPWPNGPDQQVAQPAGPSLSEREVVTWALKVGGEVTLWAPDRGELTPRTPAEIPAKFELRALTIRDRKDVTAEGLRAALGGAPHLAHLHLAGVPQVTDAALEPLAGRRLESVHLENLPRLTDRTAERLGAMPKVSRLTAVDLPGLTSAGAEALALAPGLREVVFVRISVSDAAVKALGRNPAIVRLGLRSPLGPVQVTAAGWAALGSLRELTALDLSVTGVTDDDLKCLAGLTALEELSLCENPLLSGSGLAHLKGKPRLRAIDTWGTPLTDAAAPHLAACPALERAHLFGGRLTAVGAKALSASKSIKALDLNGSPVGDEGAGALAGMPQLTELIAGTGVTGAGVRSLGRCRGLTALCLAGNPGVTGADVPALAGLAKLERLNLAGCKVADADVPALGKLGGLKHLDLTDTGVSGAGRRELKRLLPACEIAPAPE